MAIGVWLIARTYFRPPPGEPAARRQWLLHVRAALMRGGLSCRDATATLSSTARLTTAFEATGVFTTSQEPYDVTYEASLIISYTHRSTVCAEAIKDSRQLSPQPQHTMLLQSR